MVLPQFALFQFHFFRAYLKAVEGRNGAEVNNSDLWALFRETNTLALHSHFLWGVWAMIQSLTSSIEFDYVVSSVEEPFSFNHFINEHVDKLT